MGSAPRLKGDGDEMDSKKKKKWKGRDFTDGISRESLRLTNSEVWVHVLRAHS